MNFEFVRKEAKSLLKLCRSKDPLALARIRAGLPSLAELTDDQAAIEVHLADVQQALARESGLLNWSELKQQALNKTWPDFSRPGNDGESLPDGFSPWRWCVSYTVRPEILQPLNNGQEYRIFVRVLGKTAGYAELYQRARSIANGRAAELIYPAGNVPRSRTLSHGWFTHEAVHTATAYITIGVTALGKEDPIPQGLSDPKPAEFEGPGGMTPDNYPASALEPKVLHESYSDVLVAAAELSNIFLISYGEYVSSCESVDYGPFVQRAEKLARFHQPFLGGKWKIYRREWFCATTPDIVVAHIFLRRDGGD